MDLAKTQHCVHDQRERERERIERGNLIESENESIISSVISQIPCRMTLTTEKTKNEETIRGDSSWAQDEVIKCQVWSQVCLCSAAVQPILDSDTE